MHEEEKYLMVLMVSSAANFLLDKYFNFKIYKVCILFIKAFRIVWKFY